MPANKPPFDGEWVKVAEVFNLQIGKTPSRKKMEYWNTGEYDWVSIKDLGSYGRFVGRTKETISELGRIESGIKQVPSNTLLMSFKLSLGKTSITTRPIYTNEAIMAFLDKGTFQFDLGYMWHQFRTKDWATGTNMAVMGETLNKKTLGSALIRLPDLRTQRMVASHLDVIQGQLEIAAKKLERLDTLVKSRFVEMFEGDDCIQTTMGQLVSGIVAGTNVGGQQRSIGEGEYAVLKISAVTKGVFDSNQYKVVEDVSSIKMIHPRKGDLLFSRANTSEMIGATALVDRDYDRLFLPDKLWRIEPAEGVNSIFLKALLSSSRVRAEMSKVSTGSSGSMQNISMAKFRNLPGIIPPLALQQEFADFVRQVDKSRFNLLKAYGSIIALFRVLFP